MTQEELDRLHAHHLSALLEVDRICRARALKYFITGGTMLGAVRHKGFIPWDDDLDIGMLRCDYDRFVAIAQQELGDRYFLQTNRTDPEYFLPFAKIRVNGTRHVSDGWQGMNVNHGAFIDIFPIDNVPPSRAARAFHDRLTYILKMACIARSKFKVDASGKKRAYRLMRALTKPFTLRFLVRRAERAIAMFRKNRSGLVVNITGAYGYSRETFPIAYLDEYVPVSFEGYDVMTMACWHDYLTKIYGDYMQPPPEHKRKTGHEPVELKL